jgi:NhaP-type Na+/H+ or K+/H+ antiporter
MDLLNPTLALIGVVIIVAALLSGMIDRTGLPQVLLFLLLGVALGPSGLNLVNFNLESNALRVVAILGLVLVLFSDAVGLDVGALRQYHKLAALVIGPGTIISAALIGLAAWGLLHLSVPAAAILGASLASTDPVLMRSLLRREEVPPAARQALRFESGVNDVVLLPIVLIAMTFLSSEASLSGSGWSKLGLQLFLLGPGAGIGTGLVGIALLDFIRKRFGVRRDYESLYALGVAFTAYAAAEAVHGSGYLAAFAAGVTIATLDVELCDCFLDYGQATAEMFLLFTFVAFGSGLIWQGLNVISGPTLLFAAVALFIRTPVMWLSLLGVKLDAPSRTLIVWFGPRGLSSLLIILLPIFAGLAGTETLFPICALVVLLSVVLHGASVPILMRRLAPAGMQGKGSGPALAVAAHPAPQTRSPSASSRQQLPQLDTPASGERITLSELQRLWDRGEPVILLDVRKDRTYRDDDLQARGAIRLHPDRARMAAAELALPREDWLVAYCT